MEAISWEAIERRDWREDEEGSGQPVLGRCCRGLRLPRPGGLSVPLAPAGLRSSSPSCSKDRRCRYDLLLSVDGGERRSFAIKRKSKEWVRGQRGCGVPWCSPGFLSPPRDPRSPSPCHAARQPLPASPLPRHAPQALLKTNGDFFFSRFVKLLKTSDPIRVVFFFFPPSLFFVWFLFFYFFLFIVGCFF